MKSIIVLCFILQVAFLQAAPAENVSISDPPSTTEVDITTIESLSTTEVDITTIESLSTTEVDNATTVTEAPSTIVTSTSRPDFVNELCNFTACEQPDCMCLNNRPPAGLEAQQIPQFVLVTFDGAVTVTNYPRYKSLFEFKNPNGCPLRSTYFVSHMDTNYVLVHELHRHGNEIAAHSISKAFNNYQDYWRRLDYDGWRKEFGGQKKIIAQYADIPEEDIKGARAPNLQTNGNATFAALAHESFLYDCSNPSRKAVTTPFFPYTLDYGFQRVNDCPVQPCLPNEQRYPGFWEIPMNDWNVEYVVKNETYNRECATASGCILFDEDGKVEDNPSAQQIYDLFMSNFERYYNKNRAPFPIFLNEDWMGFEGHRQGFILFIEEMQKRKDVYFVTFEEMIDWMKNSTTLEEYSKTQCKEIQKTACGIEDNEHFEDAFKKYCDYKDIPDINVMEKRMFICPDQKCPEKYPWVEK